MQSYKWSQIVKALAPMSIRYRWDTFASDRYLIDIECGSALTDTLYKTRQTYICNRYPWFNVSHSVVDTLHYYWRRVLFGITPLVKKKEGCWLRPIKFQPSIFMQLLWRVAIFSHCNIFQKPWCNSAMSKAMWVDMHTMIKYVIIQWF